MRFSKRQWRFITITAFAIIFIVGVYYLYTLTQRKPILENCAVYINLYEYIIFPKEYRDDPTLPIPSYIPEEMKNRIRDDYKSVFTKKQYDKKLEKDFYSIDFTFNGRSMIISDSYQIKGHRNFKVSGNKAVVTVDVYRKGAERLKTDNGFKVHPFETNLIYEFSLIKEKGVWLIDSVYVIF